ncbi:MAG: DUF3667 domain-containing protein [Bacteroidota bacterium]
MQGPKPKRITWKHIFESFLGIFKLEKGLLYTLKGLLLHPGTTLRTYLFEDRTKLMKPFAFFIFTTTLAVLISVNLDPFSAELMKGNLPQSTNIGDPGFNGQDSLGVISPNTTKDSIAIPQTEEDTAWVGQNTTGILSPSDTITSQDTARSQPDPKFQDPNELMGIIYQKYFAKYMQVIYWLLLPVITFFSYLFFAKQKWFYPEHFILNTYLAGIQNLMYVILVPLLYVFGGNVIYGVYFVCSFAYLAFSYGNLFTQYSKLSATWRAILCNVLSFVLFTIVFGFILGIAMGIYIARQAEV